ncbi:MAG TPA: polymer-forming cytoskeletal protein [Archangium sp.]|nr:polymer-forming cytoskeletal protein [Archangium sp.]
MSRSLLSAVTVLTLLAMPAAALAGDDAKKETRGKGSKCSISVKKGDLVSQGKDLVVDGQGAVRDAVAIDGDVVVRAGSTVNDVVSIRGKVTVEAGARVSGDVSAINGNVHLQKGATVAGDVNAIGGRIQADEGVSIAGEKNELSLTINGEEFFQKIIGAALSGALKGDCELRFTEE